MIPLSTPNLSGNEGSYLEECIRSTFVSSVGPFVTRFEEMVAIAAGAKHCAATSAGTTGLHAALVALGVGRDDLVILPSLTFIASANAIAYCGAEPWLVDVDAESWTLDPDQLDALLAENTERHGNGVFHKASGRRVAAIMPVHTIGTPADMDRIMATARHYRVPVVADAAAALGATYKGQPIGAFADLSVFSFNGNKTVTSGGGGAVTGNDGELLSLVRHLTTTARVGTYYDHDRVGFNYRMTNLEAAVGCAQMERLDEFVAAKRRIRDTYDAAFGDVDGVAPFAKVGGRESAYWFSGAVIEDPALPPVPELCEGLRQRGVEARPFWKPMHCQAPYAEALRGPMDVTDGLWHRILTLPCSTHLSDSDQARVIDALREQLG